MPYCPKCDMEFVEGVTVCTDCGGALYPSREEALAAKKEAEERSQQQFLENMARMKEAMEEEMDEEAKAPSASLKGAPLSSVYVKKSARYEDMKSSASAFLFMGCATLVLAAVCAAGILPVSPSSRPVFTLVPGLIGIACLYICLKTKKGAAAMKAAAAEENKETEGLIAAFLAAHSARQMDARLAKDAEAAGDIFSELGPEELSLKRYGLIQDYLITEHDLPDPAYVDLLTEEIYNQMFGKD